MHPKNTGSPKAAGLVGVQVYFTVMGTLSFYQCSGTFKASWSQDQHCVDDVFTENYKYSLLVYVIPCSWPIWNKIHNIGPAYQEDVWPCDLGTT